MQRLWLLLVVGWSMMSTAFAAFPVITGISPLKGPAGTLLTISGQNFTGLTQVQVGQGRATVQSVSATLIRIIVPPDATTGPIQVVTTGGDAISAQTYQAAPRITRIYTELDLFGQVVSPVKGVPGQPITIEGFNFSDPAGMAVYVGNVQIPGTASADTQILGTLVTTAQTGPISVVTSAGTATTTSNVYFNPRITSFTPKAAVGDTVTFIGTSFTGVTTVLFGTAPAAFTVVANTNLQAVVPAAGPDGKISMSAPGGSFITTSNFLVLPSLTGFSPAGGPVGTVVTLNGTGLRNTSAILFGATPAITATNVSATQVTAVVPFGAFTGPITVTTLNGPGKPSTTPFYLPPRIDSFDPLSGQAGTLVTLFGANFDGVTQVQIGGVTLPNFTIASTNRITLTLPDGAPTGKWKVTSPGGSAESASAFSSIGKLPILGDFTPKSGPIGTVVTLTGVNLANATKVEFNGVNATFTVNGASVQATVPAGATTGLIRVTNPAGQGVTATAFSVGTSADLRTTLTPSANPPLAYGPLAYAIRVVNRGTLPALNTRIVLTLPEGAVFDSATGATDFDVIGRKVTFRIGTLDLNGIFSGSVRVRLPAPGSLTTTVEATSDTSEATPADNTASVVLTSVLPTLTLEALSSTLLNLQWSAQATNFVLETSILPGPGAWAVVTSGVVDDGTTRQLVLNLTDGGPASAVYRLRLNTSP